MVKVLLLLLTMMVMLDWTHQAPHRWADVVYRKRRWRRKLILYLCFCPGPRCPQRMTELFLPLVCRRILVYVVSHPTQERSHGVLASAAKVGGNVGGDCCCGGAAGCVGCTVALVHLRRWVLLLRVQLRQLYPFRNTHARLPTFLRRARPTHARGPTFPQRAWPFGFLQRFETLRGARAVSALEKIQGVKPGALLTKAPALAIDTSAKCLDAGPDMAPSRDTKQLLKSLNPSTQIIYLKKQSTRPPHKLSFVNQTKVAGF